MKCYPVKSIILLSEVDQVNPAGEMQVDYCRGGVSLYHQGQVKVIVM